MTVHSSSVSDAPDCRCSVGIASTIAAFGTDVIPLAGAIAMSSRQDPVFLPSSMPRTTYLQGRSGCESAKAGCEPGR